MICFNFYKIIDYIFGEYSFDKLRLKGWNDKKNSKFKINDIKNWVIILEIIDFMSVDIFLLKVK